MTESMCFMYLCACMGLYQTLMNSLLYLIKNYIRQNIDRKQRVHFNTENTLKLFPFTLTFPIIFFVIISCADIFDKCKIFCIENLLETS